MKTPEERVAALRTADWVKLDDLTPWDRNPRVHNAEGTKRLAAAIQRFGFLVPVTAWRSKRRLAAGHGRRMAMLRILASDPTFVPKNAPEGTPAGSVPVIWHEFESEAEFESFGIADNRQARNSEDDSAAMAAILRDLGDLAAAADEMGFDDGEIDLLLEGVAAVADSEWADALGQLPEGDRNPIQTMTFILHDDQVENVKAALAAARSLGDYGETGNENRNGNALGRVCSMFLEANPELVADG